MPFTELWLSNVSRYSPPAERIRFADELQRLARVRREDDDVFVGIGVEEPEHRQPGPVDERRRQGRRGIGRVRVAEQVIAQERAVPGDQRLRNELPAV